MEEQKVFNEENVKQLIDDYEGSITNILKIISWMRRVFGKKAFVPYIKEIIKKHVNSLEELHEAEIKIFKKNGEDHKSVLANVTDLNLFVEEVAEKKKH